MSTRAEYYAQLERAMRQLEEAGTYKHLRYLTTPMDAWVEMEGMGVCWCCRRTIIWGWRIIRR